MSFSKRPRTNAVCYTKPLDSLKGWNDHFFWVDTFACPALFQWHTGKSVLRDSVPKSFEFKVEHYATLVAFPAPFHKYPEPFLCLIGMSRNYSLDENTYLQFLHNDDEEKWIYFLLSGLPILQRLGRERDEGEPKLLETTIGRVVPLLPVALDRSSSDLEASVDKLFNEGGSGEQANQGDSTGGGHGVGVQLVDTKFVDPDEPSHLAKKPRGDYGALGVLAIGGKSRSAVQHILPEVVQHAEVKGGDIPTFPFVSSSVSTTPKRKGGDYTEFLAGANLHTLKAPQRFVISSYSFDPLGDNIAKAEVDYVARTSMPIMTNATTATPTADPAAIAKEKIFSASVFGGDSSSAGESHPISGDFSDRTGGDFLVGGIRTVVDPDSNLQRVCVPHWNVTNGFRIDDGGVCYEMVDEFAPAPNFFTSIHEMEHDQLFTEFNVEAVRLHDEAKALKERNTYFEKEKSELELKVTDLAASVKARDQEVADLDVAVTSVKLQNDSVADQLKVANDKLEKLYADFVDMALHLEEKFYHHLLTTIFGRRWLLTHGIELAITKCLHSSEYLSALGAAIKKAIEKGMQDGLAAEINYGIEGRVLADVAAYNPFLEADYFSTLQRLQNMNFSLLAELRFNKNANVDTLKNILHRVVVGATSLSFALDVFDARVWIIRENIASQRPAMRDVFTPIFEPFSAKVLMGTGGTSDTVPAPITTALFITSISAITIPPISTDDYKIAHTEGGEDAVADAEAIADEGANPFPNVSSTELDVLE
uniref:Transposase (Putative), gypsy type n=1 Tax=Tanacetum cinerariifolium TaxID=118510 RepID=A0A6L2LX99_TANCI|nr:hypothetical protein [Tanacetum cinerariifolium]